MTISIDYDRTYTRNPVLWNYFIRRAKRDGHTVVCITNRPWVPTTGPLPDCPIHAAGDQFKREFALSLGIRVDIWIDDEPGSICQPSSLP